MTNHNPFTIKAAKKPAKILIVDQDDKSCQALSKVLTDAHPEYQILFAKSTDETMALMNEQTPDLLFLDVLMPDADGFDLCLMLKNDERYKDIPLLVITTLDQLEHKVKAFKLGASDYIVKPLNATETNARVESHLRLKSFQDRQKALNAELRAAQAALMQSAKMSATGSLALGVAHEFNNILQIIGASAELCAATGKPEDTKKMLGVIRDCSGRGFRIAKGLLDFSRSDDAQEKAEVRLDELMKQNLTLMEKQLVDREIALKTKYGEVPPVTCYPGQISQVFINLINNASDAMRHTEKRVLTIELKKNKDFAQMTFSDTGCGIPEAIRPKVFEPFTTTKGVLGGGNDTTPGTGLGLSVSYAIVKRHNGTLDFETKTGTGTVFTLRLPL